MWGDKPPRRKRGSQRRLADISFFAGIGVEPSPLFEWSVFGFFWGVPKETRHRSAETSHGICSWCASLYCRLTNHFCSFSLGKMNQNRPLCKNYRFAQIFASRGGSPIRNFAFTLHKLLSQNALHRPTGVGYGGAGLFFIHLFHRPNADDAI